MVQFMLDGTRRSIRLGGVNQRDAENAREHVEQLINAKALGRTPPASTELWLRAIGDEIHEKLARATLVAPRDSDRIGLAKMLDAMIARRTDWKLATRRLMGTTRNRLVAYYGAERRARTINVAEAKDFRRHLQEAKLAEATIAKVIKNCRSFFADAMERHLVPANPFRSVTIGVQHNDSRFHFVDRETFAKLLAACPDDEWRLILSLARYGGLRLPSELLPLRWSEVLFDEHKFKVASPKTATKGKPSRWVPIFAELRPMLLAAKATAESDHLISIHRYSLHGLRAAVLRFMAEAKIKPWPKLFQNMRSTRETELIDEGKSETEVCAWIGNTLGVMRKHYHQKHADQFKRAATGAAKSEASESRTVAHQTASSPKTSGFGLDADGGGRVHMAGWVVQAQPDRRTAKRKRRDERPSAAKRAALSPAQRLTISSRKVLRAFPTLADREVARG